MANVRSFVKSICITFHFKEYLLFIFKIYNQVKTKNESAALKFTRSLAMGVLLSMFFFYGIHVLGEWQTENFRPDPETTSSVLLHNTCAVLHDVHTLRPNTDISAMGDGVSGIKLAGSFMIFFEGHIITMIIFALVTGGLIFAVRGRKKKDQQQSAV